MPPRIPSGKAWKLSDVRVPAAVLRCHATDVDGQAAAGIEADEDGLVRVDLSVSEDGRLERIDVGNARESTEDAAAAGEGGRLYRSLERIDGGERIVMPTFVDVHTHVDKSHTCERSRNEDGSLSGADKSTCEDATYWTVEDVCRRIRFCLKCAYNHGTSAVRTHLISVQRQQRLIAWEAFRLMREEWRGRVELQGVALTLLTDWKTEGYGEEVAVMESIHSQTHVSARARLCICVCV